MYFVLLAALPGQFVTDADFPQELQRAALEATVRVYHPGSKLFGVGTGAGAIVHRDKQVVYVLTAEHILPPGEVGDSVDLFAYTAKTYPQPSAEVRQARVLRRMPEFDLAVIGAVLPDHPGLLRICPKDKLNGIRFLTEAETKGKLPVLTVGIDGKGDAPTVQVDRVGGVKKAKPGCEAFFYEADRAPGEGRSGGPLVDQRGYLIGICNGRRGDKKGYYLYIGEIHDALRKNGLAFLYEDKKPAGK